MHKGTRTAYADQRVTLHLPAETVHHLREDAAAEMISLAAVARRIVSGYYKTRTPLPPPNGPRATPEVATEPLPQVRMCFDCRSVHGPDCRCNYCAHSRFEGPPAFDRRYRLQSAVPGVLLADYLRGYTIHVSPGADAYEVGERVAKSEGFTLVGIVHEGQEVPA
jgi:hypothetical protein